MTFKQIHRALKSGYNVKIISTYWERHETSLLEADIYGQDSRYTALRHAINCIKQDFKDISTLYSGNKGDCTFDYSIQYKGGV